MPIDISFADRLTNIVSLTNVFLSAGKEAEGARKAARELEEEVLKTASSPDEYDNTINEAIRGLQGPSPGNSEQTEHPEEPEEPERLNTEGPSFGAYQHATFHADGQMSTVFKAQAKDSQATVKIVALKVTYPAMMQPPHNSEREARLLVKARHTHVVPLLETIRESGGRLVLVFPFLRQDLENLLRSGRLDRLQANMIIRGLFSALEHVHALGIIHRDVKPSNILLKTMNGPVYLADFGIAWSPDDRESEATHAKITDVGTTCYRPPELLFGDRSYGTSLDIWAAGCVVAEVVRVGHEPLFDAGPLGSELGLIKSIFTTLGTPDDTVWPSAKRYPDWGKMRFQAFPGKSWEGILPGATGQAVDFVSKTVCYECTRRLTAKQALEHEFASGIAS